MLKNRDKYIRRVKSLLRRLGHEHVWLVYEARCRANDQIYTVDRCDCGDIRRWDRSWT